MDESSRRLIERSGYLRPGFADEYERFRPSPPDDLLELHASVAGRERPALVVDLGSGTGLSTRPWTALAERVVGIEPNPLMRELAVARTVAPTVEYRDGHAGATGLPEGCADIVTCSQSLHWMEPEPTFAEVRRILRSGGVFAAYDYDLPPVVDPDVDAAFGYYQQARSRLRREHDRPAGGDRRRKEEHLARIQGSGRFRYAREVVMHSRVELSGEEIVGLALSLGPISALLGDGVPPEELGLTALRETAARVLGDRRVRAWFGYRVRLAVA